MVAATIRRIIKTIPTLSELNHFRNRSSELSGDGVVSFSCSTVEFSLPSIAFPSTSQPGGFL